MDWELGCAIDSVVGGGLEVELTRPDKTGRAIKDEFTV